MRGARRTRVHASPAVLGAATLALVVVFSVAMAGGAGGEGAGGEEAPTATSPADLFRRDCAVCHGADGRGTNRAPTLVGVGAASIDYWVSTGRMPLVRHPARNPDTRDLQPLPGVQLFDADAVPRRAHPAYPPEEIRALVRYVDRLTGGSGPAVPRLDLAAASVPRGGELFRLQCAACHAWAGDGGALLHREAPALHAATPTQVAEAVRIGPGEMPAFGAAALTDEDLRDVVAYVRYLDAPRDHGGWPIWHLGPVAEGGVAWLGGIVALVLALRWMGETT